MKIIEFQQEKALNFVLFSKWTEIQFFFGINCTKATFFCKDPYLRICELHSYFQKLH